ncbi:MAG: DUF484 family protein [Proteobacteria bacterium]|nr:DUF484 family protein [Pseudomonadota bacterium]
MNVQEEENPESINITENTISEYLKDNPDFFNKHPAILAELKIPHDRGVAVSLVEKQVAVLREQNQQTRKRLHELIEIARQNEELAQRMHQLSLTLMDADDPKDIFNTLYENLKKNFHADRAIVRLFANPSFVDSFATDEFAGRDTIEQSLFKSIIEKRMPLSGRMKRQQQVFLFADDGDDIASSVMVPLHGAGWGGILAIGSFDAERFQAGMGVELLANLGEILSFILKPWVEEF